MPQATPPIAATFVGPPTLTEAEAIWAPGRAVRFFHLTTLSGLAVAAPLLDLVARHAEFLVAHRLEPLNVIGLVAILLLSPPVFLAVVELAAEYLSVRLAGAVHLGFVGALVALVCLPITVRFGLRGVVAVAGAVIVGSLCSWIYRRQSAVRLLASFLGISLIGVPGSFFLQPKIRSLFATPAEIVNSPRIDTDTPIVMVVFDEFAMWALVDGDGAINRYRYPNLASLADRSVWFPNAEAVSFTTTHAVPALVTGRRPRLGLLPTASDHPQNLFTLFARSHQTWSEETITFLCPSGINRLHAENKPEKTPTSAILADLGVVYLHIVLPPPLKSRLPPIDMGWRDFRQEPNQPLEESRDFHHNTRTVLSDFDRRVESVETFLELLGRPAESGKPALQFAHLLVPHRPLGFLPTGQRYSAEGPAEFKAEIKEKLTFSIQGHIQSQQRYYLQLGYVDFVVGEMVRRLEGSGRFDESLIILAADHGISYRIGSHRRSLRKGADPAEVLPVPLLVKKPFQTEGEVIGRPVRTIDVLPTILEILEIEPPWEFDGRSALRDGPSRGPLRIESKDELFEFGDEIHRRKLQRAREMTLRYGTGEDLLDLFRVGPFASLVGSRTKTRLQTPRDGSRDGWAVSVVGLQRYQHVEAGAPLLPVLVQGTVQVNEAAVGGTQCCDLAIAVDGIVQTTFSTASEPGAQGRVFSALLPPSSLTPGSHRFEIFLIVRSNDRIRLERLRIAESQ